MKKAPETPKPANLGAPNHAAFLSPPNLAGNITPLGNMTQLSNFQNIISSPLANLPTGLQTPLNSQQAQDLPSPIVASTPSGQSRLQQQQQLQQQHTPVTPAQPQIRISKKGITKDGESAEPPHKKAKLNNSEAKEKTSRTHNISVDDLTTSLIPSNTPISIGPSSIIAPSLPATPLAGTSKKDKEKEKEKENNKEKEKDKGKDKEKDGDQEKKVTKRKDKAATVEEDILAQCGVAIEEEARMLKEQRGRTLLQPLDKDTLERTKKAVKKLKVKPVKSLIDQEKVKKCIEKSYSKNIRKEITESRVFQDIDAQRVQTLTSRLNTEVVEKQSNIKIGNGVISLLSLSVEEYLKNVMEKLVEFAKDRLDFPALVSMKNKSQIEEEIAELNDNPEDPESKEKLEKLKAELAKSAIFKPLSNYGVEKLLVNLQPDQERLRESLKRRRSELEEKEQEKKAKEMSKTEKAEQDRSNFHFFFLQFVKKKSQKFQKKHQKITKISKK